ncbi:unnamed protein product, partial [Dicrocoelium dendriticum]
MRRPCMNQNRELSCYLLTKISWKGSYKRLLSIGTMGITTYNKDLLRVTNQWLYSEIHGCRPDKTIKSGQLQPNRLILTLSDPNRKRYELTFASDHRVDVLTDLLRFRHRFSERIAQYPKVPAVKLGWSERVSNVLLMTSPISLDQIDASSGAVLKSYLYRDLECLDRSITSCGFLSLDVSLELLHFSLLTFEDEFTSQSEFTVQKVVHRLASKVVYVSRLLCITDTFLLERDPLSYRAVCAYPLCEIYALVRDRGQPQQFSVELVRSDMKTYCSTDRDALLASLLDSVRASGNRDVCVRSCALNRAFRFCPTIVPASEEVESVHLRFLRQQPEGVSFWECVQRFNANVAYSGLTHAVTQDGMFVENKERLIRDALSAILTQPPPGLDATLADSLPGVGSKPMNKKPNTLNSDSHTQLILLEAQFHALRRLVASKTGFNAFTQLPGMRVTLGRIVVSALRRRDDAVAHAVLDAINTLMHPMHEAPDIRQEQLNKTSIMSSEAFMSRLVDIFTLHSLRGTGALVLCALLDFFTFAICLPYSETSDGGSFDCLLRLVANRGRALFRLFHHPSLAIVRGAGLVMRALIEEGGDEVASEMRSLALSEGALFHHLSVACFAQGKDARSLAVKQLSRQLVALWTERSPEAQDLLKRMFPLGLLAFLESDASPPVVLANHLPNRDNLKLAQDHMSRVEERKQTIRYQMETRIENLLTHWRLRVGLPPPKPNINQELEDRPVVLRLPRHQRQKLRPADSADTSPRTNWKYFFYQFEQDHAKPDLVWNLPGDCDLHAPSHFTHSAYAHELLIGEVFVRLYNKQPSYQLEDPKAFTIALLKFIAEEVVNVVPQAAQKAEFPITSDCTEPANSDLSASLSELDDIDWSAEAESISNLTLSRLIISLDALSNVIHHNVGVEVQCIGHFPLLFSITQLHGYPELQTRALEVIQSVSSNNECLADIAASQVLSSMAMLFPSLPRCHQLLIETFDHLVMSTPLLKELVYSGGLVYLLEILVRSPSRRVREAAVNLLSHCLADKQVGRRIQALLCQYLPPIFPETLRDTPEAFLNLFDADHENPELIWNTEFRNKLASVVSFQSKDFYTNQIQNPKIRWSLPDSFHVGYADVLMKAATERLNGNAASGDEDQLIASTGPVVVAGVYLHLYVASPGWVLRRPEVFLDSILERWTETIGQLPESAILLRLLTKSCVAVLTGRPGLLDSLPRKGYLHRIAELLHEIRDPEGAKAAVLLLHKMSTSKVTKSLESHPNWAEYRDQGHALFLSNAPHSATAYLTAGPSAGSLHSGYLTSASALFTSLSQVEPPPPFANCPPSPPPPASS